MPQRAEGGAACGGGGRAEQPLLDVLQPEPSRVWFLHSGTSISRPAQAGRPTSSSAAIDRPGRRPSSRSCRRAGEEARRAAAPSRLKFELRAPRVGYGAALEAYVFWHEYQLSISRTAQAGRPSSSSAAAQRPGRRCSSGACRRAGAEARRAAAPSPSSRAVDCMCRCCAARGCLKFKTP